MTVEEIQARVAKIRKHVEDRNPEYSHPEEDDLYADVLAAIAAGAEDPAAIAAAALETKKIPNFERWHE